MDKHITHIQNLEAQVEWLELLVKSARAETEVWKSRYVAEVNRKDGKAKVNRSRRKEVVEQVVSVA